MEILIAGSLAFDRIMIFPGRFGEHIMPDKTHNLSVCFLVDSVLEHFGGTGGNIAYSMSLLGQSPLVLTCVGRDFAPRYTEWMEINSLSQAGLRVIDKEMTAGCVIVTDKGGNQITLFSAGAMAHQSDYGILEKYDPAKTLLAVSPTGLDDIRNFSKKAKELGIPFIFDPGQNIPAFSGPELLEMLDQAFLFISNDYELNMFLKQAGISKTQLLEKTSGRMITTCGEDGSILTVDGQEMEIPAALPAEVEDPTGAGDAFRAGLLTVLAACEDFSEMAALENLLLGCRLGSAAASFCLEKDGPQEHVFTEDRFKARYENAFGPLDPKLAGFLF